MNESSQSVKDKKIGSENSGGSKTSKISKNQPISKNNNK